MFTLRRIGQSFYALALIAFGIQMLVYRGFVTRAIPAWPVWILGRPLWALIIAVMLIAAGLCLLFNMWPRAIALTLGIALFCSFLLLGLPIAMGDVPWGGLWTSAMKALALSGGALIIAGTVRSVEERSSFVAPPERFVMVGRVFLGAFLILGGIQHFIWRDFVATLVPAWIPEHVFWTYVAGVALIAGGLGLMMRITVKLAALLVGIMIFLWVITLHIPRALADVHNANETTAVFEALAFSGVAFVLTASIRSRRRY